MSFQNALTQLANLTVSGIAQNYSIDKLPDALHRSQLPALLVMPIDIQDDTLFRESGRAFDAIAFSDGAKTVQIVTTHLLLIAPQKQGNGLCSHLPALVTAIDAYFTALGADVTLSNTLEEPAIVRVDLGLFTLGGTVYIGCAFRHRWLIAV